jgi:hypothetical protein
LLFERLVEEFGLSLDLGKSSSPGNGKDRKFDEFCQTFSKSVGAESGEAVKMQIAFGSPIAREGTSHWKPGHARNAILCLASAFEAGFITNADFPKLTASAK